MINVSGWAPAIKHLEKKSKPFIKSFSNLFINERYKNLQLNLEATVSMCHRRHHNPHYVSFEFHHIA